jgi:hypothetical protein
LQLYFSAVGGVSDIEACSHRRGLTFTAGDTVENEGGENLEVGEGFNLYSRGYSRHTGTQATLSGLIDPDLLAYHALVT